MYLLDANAFMEASRLYYSFQIAPGFWQWLSDSFRAGTVASVTAVHDEIAVGDDDLADWAKDPELRRFWLPDSAESISVMAELAVWANSPERIYKPSAISEFMGSADLRLIAQAKAVGATVVTRETSEPHSRRKIKIPDAAHSALNDEILNDLGPSVDAHLPGKEAAGRPCATCVGPA